MAWRDTTIGVGLAVVVVAFVPTVLVIPRQTFFQTIDVVVFAASVALILGHAYTMLAAARSPIRTVGLGQLLTVGTFVIALALACIFGNLWAWRTFEKPEWLADWFLAAFSRGLLAAGLFAAITVNYTTGGRVTISSYRRSAMLFGIAALVAVLLIWLGLAPAGAHAGCENGCRYTTLILTCPSTLLPEECTAETAYDLTRGARADNPLTCGLSGQTTMAATVLTPGPGQYQKIVCVSEPRPAP